MSDPEKSDAAEARERLGARHAEGCEARLWHIDSPRYKGPCTCGLTGRAVFSYDELQVAYSKLVTSYHEFAECILFNSDDPIIRDYVKKYIAEVGLDV